MATDPLFGVANGQTDAVLAAIDRHDGKGVSLMTLIANGVNQKTAHEVVGALIRAGVIKGVIKGTKETCRWKEYSRA